MSLRGAVAKPAAMLLVGVVLWAISPSLLGAVNARVTRVIKDVALVRPGSAARPALVNDVVATGAVIRTGPDSRVELTFADRSVLRLGARTVLTLGEETLNLGDGAVLFQVPAGTSGPSIQAGTMSLDPGQSTGIVERWNQLYTKVMVLQGTPRVFVAATVGESLLLSPGQILITKPSAVTLPEPVDYNIGQLYKTSRLTSREFARLGSESDIIAEIQKQKSDPKLIPTNLIIYGRGTLVTLTNPTPAGQPARKPPAAPKPSPGRSAAPKRSPTPTPTPRR